MESFPHLPSCSSINTYAVHTQVWWARELIQLHINPEEENRQLPAQSASKFDSVCSLKLAQRRPWLYIIYWNSSSNHQSFSHFEPELHSSLQFGWDTYAEVLYEINKSFPIKKTNKQKVLSEFLTISISDTACLRVSSQTVLVWTHITLEDFSWVRQLLQTPDTLLPQ